MVSESAGVV